MPLGRLTTQSPWTELAVDADQLAAGVPKEAWIHLAIARRRPDVGGICRAQPPVATALASAGVPILPLHGQGAYLGAQVPIFDDAILVRDQHRAGELAETLGRSTALILRGNGAVTIGDTVGEAVARMWVLEASARMNHIAAAAGTPSCPSPDEQSSWQAVAAEILGRIWADLRRPLQLGLGAGRLGATGLGLLADRWRRRTVRATSTAAGSPRAAPPSGPARRWWRGHRSCREGPSRSHQRPARRAGQGSRPGSPGRYRRSA